MKYKYKIYKEELGEKEIFFRLEEDFDNSIVLSAYSKEGRLISNILGIDRQGIVLFSHINEEIGLPLERNGYVITRKY